MEFRPCIDIHNGKVKQIVGSSLRDKNDKAEENYVSDQDAAFFADFYKKDKIKGGHVIMLNPPDSPFYEKTKEQALKALESYPGGFQIGGGITEKNADLFLVAGASHVIVTSYIFKDGQLFYQNLDKLTKAVGKKHLVIDLSCRKKDGEYYVVTNRWQDFTKERIGEPLLMELAAYCDEFLIHGADVEGKTSGVDVKLIRKLSHFTTLPVTYAGGISSWEDLEIVKKEGHGRINITIGSALDLFGGKLSYKEVLNRIKKQ